MKLRIMAKNGNALRIFNKSWHDKQCRVVISEIEEADYINNKSNKPYFLLGEVINATNENNGQKMFLYSDGEHFYVREQEEFKNKFHRP